MRVLFLTTNPASTVASTRYRISQYLPALSAAGHEAEVSTFYPDGPRTSSRAARFAAGLRTRALDAARAGSFDVVFIHREVLPFAWNHVVNVLPRRVPVVFDFDDAVFLAGSGDRRPSLPRSTRRLVERADWVLAGNEFLASYARRSHARVEILPTVVDTEIYRPAPRAHEVPLVGWIGSPTTSPYVQSILPMLDELGRTHRFRLRIVGGATPPSMSHVEVESPRWSAETEAAMFSDLDVGIYPLPNDIWVLGKCGFKAIQYMASGVSCVVSPFGPVREIVRDGVDGLWAERPEEFVRAVGRLLEDPALRARMGREGRTRAIAEYSLARTAPAFIASLERAVELAARRA